MSFRDVVWSCVPSRLPQETRTEIVDAVEQAFEIELKDQTESLKSQLKIREEQLNILKEALVHYSKGDGMLTYREDGNGIGYWNGDRAREALRKIEELSK